MALLTSAVESCEHRALGSHLAVPLLDETHVLSGKATPYTAHQILVDHSMHLSEEASVIPTTETPLRPILLDHSLRRVNFGTIFFGEEKHPLSLFRFHGGQEIGKVANFVVWGRLGTRAQRLPPHKL